MTYSKLGAVSKRGAAFGLFVGVLGAATLATAQGPERAQAIRLQPITPRIERLNPVREGRGAFESLRQDRATITVRGIVQNTLGHLVPLSGTVLVRSLADGSVAGRAEVDALAQFSIRGFEPGIYTAELIGPAGSVLATTNAFSADRGDVIQLVPVIPTAPESGPATTLWTVTSGIVTAAANAGTLLFNLGQPITPQ